MASTNGTGDASCAPYIDCDTAESHSNETALSELSRRIDELTHEVSTLRQENEVLTQQVADYKRKLNAVLSEKEVAKKSEKNTYKPPSRGTEYTSNKFVGEFNTSYYGMDCVGCTGRTASGYNTKGRTTYNGMTILAADTSILPLRTKVRVVNPDGSNYVGIVLDRGGAIKGRKLDVLVGSEEESSKYGRHMAKVYVLEYGNNKYIKED